MPTTARKDQVERDLHRISRWIEQGNLERSRTALNSLHPAEIAHILEALEPFSRKIAWSLVTAVLRGEVLVELNDEVRNGLIDATTTRDLIDAAETLETDDLADIADDLPAVALERLLHAMNNQDRQRLEAVLSYDEHSAGGLMNLDTLTVRQNVTLDVVFRYLRLRGEIPDLTDSLMVVNRDDLFLGVLPLSRLLTHDEELMVSDLMVTDVDAIPADLPSAEVALLFEQQDLVSSPVIDGNGRLLGRITVDDVVDVIRDEADHSIMSMAGLDEEQDMFAPVVRSARRRALWLGVNLLTAFLASWVIGRFEPALEKMVALAVLMPIVASMGGIAGTQTLTLVVRGLALRQIGRSNARLLILKELGVGILNGMIWAVVVATVAGVWFHNLDLGLLIGAAIVISLVCAALAGAVIPLLLNQLEIDPALAGGVLLTTVTDVVGFFAFLGLATIYLL